MISERQFIRNFPEFWREAFPKLDDHVRDIFRLSSPTSRFITEWSTPILSSAEAQWNDLIAELAFTAFSRGITAPHGNDNQNGITEDDISVAIAKMGLIRGVELARQLLTDEILHDAEVLRVRLDKYFSQFHHVVVHPRLRGFSVLSALHPDVIVGQVIYEVKASKFNFKREDLKQLLVYYLLSQINDLSITHLCLTNPRRGVDYLIDVTELYVSLGAPSRSQLLSLFTATLRG